MFDKSLVAKYWTHSLGDTKKGYACIGLEGNKSYLHQPPIPINAMSFVLEKSSCNYNCCPMAHNSIAQPPIPFRHVRWDMVVRYLSPTVYRLQKCMGNKSVDPITPCINGNVPYS